MLITHHVPALLDAGDCTFEAPELRVIGHADTVIQGFFGTGWDGPYGMTEPMFEFEADDAVD